MFQRDNVRFLLQTTHKSGANPVLRVQPRKTKPPQIAGFSSRGLPQASTFYVVGRVAIAKRWALRDNKSVHHVYLLECADDKSWYIGYSANLKQRIERQKKGDGARTTKRKQRWELIYYEAYKNEQDAKGRERFLKSGSGRRYLKKQLEHHLKKV